MPTNSNIRSPATPPAPAPSAYRDTKLTELKKPNGNVIKDVRDVGYNPVKYFPITDKEAIPRRQAVKIENCNVCHAMLATHGEARRNAEFCVLCHNPSHTDEEKRKAANGPMPPENVHYKRLIHRIHTGINAGEPFIVYGGPPAKPGPIDLSDIRFPGDRRNCVKCHVPGANEPPLPAGLLPTLDSSSRWNPQSHSTDHQRLHRLPYQRNRESPCGDIDGIKRAGELRCLSWSWARIFSGKSTQEVKSLDLQDTTHARFIVVLLPHFSAAEDQGEGKRLYQSYCTGCHGASGKGDGPAGKTLPVKPADHTNGREDEPIF